MLEFSQCNLFTGAPSNSPVLVVTPDPDSRFRAYSEDTIIRAACTVKDTRPAANILWYMGELLFQPLQ